MASDVDIANMALAHIGSRSNIASLTEDSKEARKINLFYNTALAATLEAHDWAFARKTEQLSESGTPPQTWVYQYAYPNLCAAVRAILPVDRTKTPIPFQVAHSDIADSKVILTDEPAAKVRYTAFVTNTTMFSGAFVEAFSAKLASLVAMPLTGKRTLRDDAVSLFNMLIQTARAVNINEEETGDSYSVPWLDART